MTLLSLQGSWPVGVMLWAANWWWGQCLQSMPDHPAFPQHSSFQDANRKKQTVSGVSLSRKEFVMHICLLCLTLALILFFFRLLAIKESKLHIYKPSKPPTSDFVMGKMFIATSLLIISLVLDYYVKQLFVTVIKCPISWRNSLQLACSLSNW